MKPVGIAELKAHLSRYIHAVRRGQTVTVLDRKEPVALVVPITSERRALRTQRAIRPLREVTLPPPLPGKVDSLAALLEDRRERR
jgi:prevent-host-death family protein